MSLINCILCRGEADLINIFILLFEKLSVFLLISRKHPKESQLRKKQNTKQTNKKFTFPMDSAEADYLTPEEISQQFNAA